MNPHAVETLSLVGQSTTVPVSVDWSDLCNYVGARRPVRVTPKGGYLLCQRYYWHFTAVRHFFAHQAFPLASPAVPGLVWSRFDVSRTRCT